MLQWEPSAVQPKAKPFVVFSKYATWCPRLVSEVIYEKTRTIWVKRFVQKFVEWSLFIFRVICNCLSMSVLVNRPFWHACKYFKFLCRNFWTVLVGTQATSTPVFALKNWLRIFVQFYEVLESSPAIHASGVLDFLLDRTALWVGGLRKVGINLQLRHIGLHRVELHRITRTGIYKKNQIKGICAYDTKFFSLVFRSLICV